MNRARTVGCADPTLTSSLSAAVGNSRAAAVEAELEARRDLAGGAPLDQRHDLIRQGQVARLDPPPRHEGSHQILQRRLAAFGVGKAQRDTGHPVAGALEPHRRLKLHAHRADGLQLRIHLAPSLPSHPSRNTIR